MTRDELMRMYSELELRKGAADEAIVRAEVELNFALPDDYRSFLKISNGAAGFVVADGYVELWPASQLSQSNQDYGFPEYCPEVVAFGTNGGGEAFGFRRDNSNIVIVPLIGLEIKHALHVATTFWDFLKQPFPEPWQ